MAVITPSSLISEIRGSIGDVTYSRNRYGAYTKAKLIQPASNTAAQQLRRDALAEGVAAWQAIGDDEFTLWQKYVKEQLVSKNISRQIVRAAYNEFISRYVNRSLVDGVSSGFAPYPRARVSPIITSIAQATTSILLNYDCQQTPSNIALAIFATAPVSSTVRSFSKSAYKFLTYIEPTSQTDSTQLFSLLNALYSFTSADVGKRIAFSIKCVNTDNFAASQSHYSSMILESTTIAAPPQVVQSKTDRQGSGTSKTFSFNSVPVDGQLIVIAIRTGTTAAYTVPSGFNLVNTAYTGNPALAIYYKIASSESNSYTFTATTSQTFWAFIGYTISNVNQTTPIDAKSQNSSGASNVTTIAAGAAAITASANSLLLAFACSSSSSSAPSVDNSFTNLLQAGTGGIFNLISAERSYTSLTVSQNCNFSWTTTGRGRANIFEIQSP